jgi:hypothetical protein
MFTALGSQLFVAGAGEAGRAKTLCFRGWTAARFGWCPNDSG